MGRQPRSRRTGAIRRSRDVTIRGAEGAADIAAARWLFLDYERSLGIDLCFQGFEDELAGLPGDYQPPHGRLFLACVGRAHAGCVALRRHAQDSGEIKRLFVRLPYRGTGLGRKLAQTAIEAAREIGYARVLLDTLPSMREAIALYRSLGFREIPPYRENSIEGALFMELRL